MENVLVSIIVITYNSSKYLLESLESVKSQSYQNIELIVSDDGSKDDTLKVCQKWLDENKKRFVSTKLVTVKENTGIPANCNRGLFESKGDWVKLIAGDDILDLECIKLNMGFIESSCNNIQILTSNMYSFDSNQSLKSYENIDMSHFKFNSKDISVENQYKIALRMAYINVPTLFIKRSLFVGIVGFFDEAYKLYEDKPWILKALKSGIKIYFAPFFSVYYRKSVLSVQRLNSQRKLIPDFQLVRDQFLLKHVIPELTTYEKILHLYVIYTKRAFIYFTKNKKSVIYYFLLNVLTKIPYKLISKYNSKYV